MLLRTNTIEGTERAERTGVVVPVEELITRQSECSCGNRNECVILVGGDEGSECPTAHCRGAYASMNCNEEKDEHFELGNAFEFCLG